MTVSDLVVLCIINDIIRCSVHCHVENDDLQISAGKISVGLLEPICPSFGFDTNF
jgi:hypothetical protein